MATDSTQSFQANKILIAEDNPVVRKGLVSFLEKWGYDVTQVDNGDEAWQTLEDNLDIRLAIVDWNLPGLSGMQVLQRLRVRSNAPYVYAIMFSGRKSKEEQILALDGGADDYLVKPCKPSELRARLGVGRRIIETAFKVPTPAEPAPEPTPKEEKKPEAKKE